LCLALAAEFAGGKSRERHNKSLRQRDEKPETSERCTEKLQFNTAHERR
jgi:hypothetical protein